MFWFHFGVKMENKTTLEYDLRSAIAVKHLKETIHTTKSFCNLFETYSVQISEQMHLHRSKWNHG